VKGIDYLSKKLDKKRTRALLRYKFYEQKQFSKDLGISTPEGLEWFNSVNGWCSKAVDNLADRLQFDGFAKDNFMFAEMFDQNNPDIFFDDAMLSSLITACSFVYVSRGENGVRFQVIDGSNATGVIDDFTKLMTEGYAVLERDDYDKPTMWAYFMPGVTMVYQKGEIDPIAVETFTSEYCALVPVIYKPDARRPFGHSRISRACMDYTLAAMRTIKRSEISAEFYSFPQKYATGLAQDSEEMDTWQATMSAMLTFTKDEDGDRPTIGQFQVGSMTPHVEMMKNIASMFAGETGLTLDDLGFASGNPSSYEAIKASHENLRLKAKAAQRTFGVGFLNAGYLAACVRDDYKYERTQLYLTRPVWAPPFPADVSTLGGIGDALMKLNTSYPDYITEDKLIELVGI
jgi:hypothetical protein